MVNKNINKISGILFPANIKPNILMVKINMKQILKCVLFFIL